jgi:hypothetical protein
LNKTQKPENEDFSLLHSTIHGLQGLFAIGEIQSIYYDQALNVQSLMLYNMDFQKRECYQSNKERWWGFWSSTSLQNTGVY